MLKLATDDEERLAGVLHGDLHHGNVLDFRAPGWLAIDSKRLAGERGFGFASIFTNPDLDDPTRPVATEPDGFARRLQVVSEAAGVERDRLLRWNSAAIDLRVAELAAAELAR